jgi:hypothetical protein
MQRMVAEIIFVQGYDARPGVAELTAHGFDCEVLPWIDGDGVGVYSDAVWLLARLDTELDINDFCEEVQSIVEPIGGDLVDAGNSDAAIDLERKHRENDQL